jgi:hypothetical protein
MIKKWLKNITGLSDIEADALRMYAELEQLKLQKETALEDTQKAIDDAQLSKLSEKERATRKGESWVSVLDTKVNPDNIRNGFFELDWNELFVKELILNGYGTDADPEEEIVDRWFREIVYNMFADEGLDTTRGSGYINVVPISKGKSEVS